MAYEHKFKSCQSEDEQIVVYTNQNPGFVNTTLYRMNEDKYLSVRCWIWISTEEIPDELADGDYVNIDIIATESLSCDSCNIIYKATNCSTGDKFYITIRNTGEFKINEFKDGEFNIHMSEYISTSKRIMLPDGQCVKVVPINFDQDIYNSIKDEYKITDLDIITQVDSCDECNRIGYGLEDKNENKYYIENSDNFKIYSGRVLKVVINDEIFCARVFEYKYYTKTRSGIAEIVVPEDGGNVCFDDFSKCGEIITENNEFTYTRRKVEPGHIAKHCGGCNCK